MNTPWLRRLKEVNGELWLLLSLFLVAMLLNYMVSMHRVVLGFYVLPTIFSAYFYIPIILAHHDKFDGSGYNPTRGKEIPLESRIIAVADVYDALTSDRPYRKAITPFNAKEIILKGAGTEFDPTVVRAFSIAFGTGQMEVPELVV